MSREATNSSEGNRKGVGQSGITRTGWKLEMVVERLCSDPSLDPKNVELRNWDLRKRSLCLCFSNSKMPSRAIQFLGSISTSQSRRK